MHPFEKLLVWQRAHALAVRLHGISAPWRDFAMRDQVRRAAYSVPANIAEGAGGDSQRHLAKYVGIALASAAELRSLIILARDVSLLDTRSAAALDDEAEQLRRMLMALRKRVLSRAEPPPR